MFFIMIILFYQHHQSWTTMSLFRFPDNNLIVPVLLNILTQIWQGGGYPLCATSFCGNLRRALDQDADFNYI